MASSPALEQIDTQSGYATAQSRTAANPEVQSAVVRLGQLAFELSGAQTSGESKVILDKVREYLTSLPPDSAVSAVRAILDTNGDTLTKLDFVLGPDRQLTEAPSLRVWLLDCLGEIDRDAAADYARSILSAPSSPDEWAVSLRDYALARTEPQDVAFIRSKAQELLQNAAWQQNPSGGFLEAFDTIVYTNATALTPDLAELIKRKDNRAVAHAAYLTLDRLVINQPRDVLALITANPEIMQGREQTRANYLARADVRDPEQRTLLESYLLDPHRTPQELHTFASIYPNANFMISNNLLTRTETPTQGDFAARDREAMHVIESWLADSRFSPLKPQIEEIRSRLAVFLRQASPAHDAVSPK